ncbi:2-oxoglutarate and iron-dependent oxygenase domain-containing protein [Streptomyces sp. NBC_00015]|uniref:2-oxoglutarate and iron-dependent oxygenase domain-containing protein n=1 Tax=unclassified Streptomyces TaxID=2593676 RepID=UPI002251E1CF|nr:2-oxoglutarate and iron-dependent oxygenase domain-containing protein [Streptomyces sp. NBC_00103]MCX5374205.1 2-oxoglutarate and iron-dependent oxygenase domain-containing protein [Streptomyces sp. NBC_00103]
MAQPTALPVVGISRFRDPGTDRDALLAGLRAAAHEVGFRYVTGHGVPPSVRDEALHAARAFLALGTAPTGDREPQLAPVPRLYAGPPGCAAGASSAPTARAPPCATTSACPGRLV